MKKHICSILLCSLLALSGASFADESVSDKADRAWEATKKGASDAWDATKEGTADAWDATKEGSAELWDDLSEGASDLWDSATESTEDALEEAEELWEGAVKKLSPEDGIYNEPVLTLNRNTAGSTALYERMPAASDGASASSSSLSPEEDFERHMMCLRSFMSDYVQEVYNADGKVLSSSSGFMALKKPDNFIMQSLKPDRLSVYVKNNELFFYDEAVSQLSIYSLASLEDNPFLLLINDKADLNSFSIGKDGSRFTLFPKESNNIRSVTVSFAPHSVINDTGNTFMLLESVTIRMSDGNTNFYRFIRPRIDFAHEVFDVQIPESAEVYDER